MVPTTITMMAASITAYSAMSWPSPSTHRFKIVETPIADMPPEAVKPAELCLHIQPEEEQFRQVNHAETKRLTESGARRSNSHSGSSIPETCHLFFCLVLLSICCANTCA